MDIANLARVDSIPMILSFVRSGAIIPLFIILIFIICPSQTSGWRGETPFPSRNTRQMFKSGIEHRASKLRNVCMCLLFTRIYNLSLLKYVGKGIQSLFKFTLHLKLEPDWTCSWSAFSILEYSYRLQNPVSFGIFYLLPQPFPFLTVHFL